MSYLAPEVAVADYKSYSFKSVGQLQSSYEDQQINTLPSIPVGITTPVSFGGAGQMFSMTFDVKQQIKDNLKNLILTNSGERLMLTAFGANLRPLVMELTNDDVASEAIRRISKTVAKYMPYVELDTFETKIQNSQNGNTVGVVIRVGYSIPSIGITNQFVETIIYVAG